MSIDGVRDMLTYSIGYLLGKLLLAYVLVWLVCLFIARFKYRSATLLAHGKKGIVAITLVFLIPFISGVGNNLA